VLLTTNGNFNKSKMFAVNKGTKAMHEVLKLGRIYSLSTNCQLDNNFDQNDRILIFTSSTVGYLPNSS
jgi:hypothetical protein